VAGCCEHCNEPSGSVRCKEFRKWFRIRWFLKKDSAPWNLFIIPLTVKHGSRDSSVGIATSYGLDDRGVGVRDPVV
jgi:hypothetical protein